MMLKHNLVHNEIWKGCVLFKVSREVVPKKLGTSSPGEAVPMYDFSWRSHTCVRLLWEKSHASILGYEFSWRIVPTKSWVRLLLLRTCTQDFVIKNDKIFFLKRTNTQYFINENDKVFHQKLNPKFGGYKFSRTCTLKLTSTNSPIFWVRLFLGMTSPEVLFNLDCVLVLRLFQFSWLMFR
jgi:hypothetical protein